MSSSSSSSFLSSRSLSRECCVRLLSTFPPRSRSASSSTSSSWSSSESSDKSCRESYTVASLRPSCRIFSRVPLSRDLRRNSARTLLPLLPLRRRLEVMLCSLPFIDGTPGICRSLHLLPELLPQLRLVLGAVHARCAVHPNTTVLVVLGRQRRWLASLNVVVLTPALPVVLVVILTVLAKRNDARVAESLERLLLVVERVHVVALLARPETTEVVVGDVAVNGIRLLEGGWQPTGSFAHAFNPKAKHRHLVAELREHLPHDPARARHVETLVRPVSAVAQALAIRLEEWRPHGGGSARDARHENVRARLRKLSAQKPILLDVRPRHEQRDVLLKWVLLHRLVAPRGRAGVVVAGPELVQNAVCHLEPHTARVASERRLVDANDCVVAVDRLAKKRCS
mmetsp:Transcript_13298/g.43797  ORF Transcript_13298/g.43797 Transcript_13298/m.43797 type:complete len:398 (+) Transcript_13298:2942-4135(+)